MYFEGGRQGSMTAQPHFFATNRMVLAWKPDRHEDVTTGLIKCSLFKTGVDEM